MTAQVTRRRAGSALRMLVVTELRLFLREKAAVFWGMLFPLALLVIFGSIPGFHQPDKNLGGQTLLAVYVPVLMAMTLALLGLSALPTVLAGYREKGILRRLATTPVGPARLLAAQLAVHAGAALVTMALIMTVASAGYGVGLPRQAAGFLLALILAVAALLALGLVVAALARTARAAQPIGSLLFFPLMFFAGLWLPIAAMPAMLRHISQYSPLGAAVQALQDAALGGWPHPQQLAVLAGYAIAFSVAAVTLFRWE
jgi:ABC-2 type transport system permease protein